MCRLIDNIKDSLRIFSLFTEEFKIPFISEQTVCPDCLSPLSVYKTKEKTVFTLHIGEFTAKETLLKCNHCQNETIYSSAELLKLVPHGCCYGYDVMVYIGEATFLQHMQGAEIQQALQLRNIQISISEVEYLAKKFIIYLSAIHEKYNLEIVEALDSNGGYILHIDALGGTKGGERLISGVDGISDFVLGNAKIKSENSDYIKPFLETIKTRFGEPLAVVQDMGRGIMKATKEVFPTVKMLICHFHFLRDIGKDLLEENYDIIRKRLRHFCFLTTLRNLSKDLKIMFENLPDAVDEFYQLCDCNETGFLNTTASPALYLYTLIEWILDWKSASNGYGFPFDRPHLDLALRVRKAVKFLDSCSLAETNNNDVCKIQSKLYVILSNINQDTTLNESIYEINGEIIIFDKLRNAMRIAPENGVDGLNDDGNKADIKTIEKEVNEFITEQEKTFTSMKNKKIMKLLKQLNKYREQLFSDPIVVKTTEGIKTIQPQRTNNLMERMFRDFTRDNKRKTGVDTIGNTIRAMVADTPLIRNLKNEQYREIIIGENENLAEVFSSIDVSTIRKKMNEHAICNEKIPKKIKALLKEDKLLGILTNIGKSIENHAKSN